MEVVKIRKKYQVTIPEKIREKVCCKVGDYVAIEVKGNEEIILKPVVLEERYSEEELETLEKLFAQERKEVKVLNAKEFKEKLVNI